MLCQLHCHFFSIWLVFVQTQLENHMKKLALVTGASKGLGVYLVKALLESNYRVLGVSRSLDVLKSLQKELAHKDFEVASLDLSKVDQLMEQSKKLVDTYGDIDVLVHNAGIEQYSNFDEYSLLEIQSIMTTNLIGPMELTRALLPALSRTKGVIIGVASLAGKKAIPFNSIYSASKGGMLLWLDALRQECRGKGIRVTSLVPGYMKDAGLFHETGMKAPALIGASTPEHLVKKLRKALKHGGFELIVSPGPTRAMLALNQLLPGVGDFVLRKVGIKKMNAKFAKQSTQINRNVVDPI